MSDIFSTPEEKIELLRYEWEDRFRKQGQSILLLEQSIRQLLQRQDQMESELTIFRNQTNS